MCNVHEVNDIRHTEIHTAEPLVPESSTFDGEKVIENLKDTNRQVLLKFQ